MFPNNSATMYNHANPELEVRVMSSQTHGYNYEPQYSEGPAHEVAPFSRVSIAQHSEGMGHGSTAPLSRVYEAQTRGGEHRHELLPSSRTPVKRMRVTLLLFINFHYFLLGFINFY